MGLDLSKIRSQFPCLKSGVLKKAPIYFDNACMTLKPNSVIDSITDYYNNHPSCHNRAIHKFGKLTTEKFDSARETVGKFIGAKSSNNIVFTKNTTEGINLIANSLGFSSGDVVLTSDLEHNSNLLPWQFLSRRSDVEHLTFAIDLDGQFDLTEYQSRLEKNKVKLVSVFHTSHVMGISLPIARMVEIAHDNDALFLLDAAQALSHSKIDVEELDLDFMAFSFHKAFGPTGCGALYGKSELLDTLHPFIVGGETVIDTHYHDCTLSPVPARFEAGLQDYAGFIATSAALKFIDSIGHKAIEEHLCSLNTFLTEFILSNNKIHLLGPTDPGVRPSICNFYIEGIDSGELSILLDQTKNIMVRSGVHCCHAWYHKHDLAPSLRVSLSIYNTIDEIKDLIAVLLHFLRFHS